MTPEERVESALEDLDSSLVTAAKLVGRGREAFESDIAVLLAFEALTNRIGEMAKLLVTLDPVRFSDPIWSRAARNRDFVVHHYDKVDIEVLWDSVTTGFRDLHRLVGELRGA